MVAKDAAGTRWSGMQGRSPQLLGLFPRLRACGCTAACGPGETSPLQNQASDVSEN